MESERQHLVNTESETQRANSQSQLNGVFNAYSSLPLKAQKEKKHALKYSEKVNNIPKKCRYNVVGTVLFVYNYFLLFDLISLKCFVKSKMKQKIKK